MSAVVFWWLAGSLALAVPVCAPLALYLLFERRRHNRYLARGGMLFCHGVCGPCIDAGIEAERDRKTRLMAHG